LEDELVNESRVEPVAELETELMNEAEVEALDNNEVLAEDESEGELEIVKTWSQVGDEVDGIHCMSNCKPTVSFKESLNLEFEVRWYCIP
jgi:hypothetical protein